MCLSERREFPSAPLLVCGVCVCVYVCVCVWCVCVVCVWCVCVVCVCSAVFGWICMQFCLFAGGYAPTDGAERCIISKHLWAPCVTIRAVGPVSCQTHVCHSSNS